MIRVLINGASGKMGRVTTVAVDAASDLELASATGRDDDLVHAIIASAADVVVDFTTPDAVSANTMAILETPARPVIGTTGLSGQEIEQIEERCKELRRGALVIANFSVGAVLMQRMAQLADPHFSAAEIIETHAPHKQDAPSGTALETARQLAPRQTSPHGSSPSRGDAQANVPIHSLRLPGLVAEQEVRFAGEGQTLTIAHRIADRRAFMPGVLAACRHVMKLETLGIGLDCVLGFDWPRRHRGGETDAENG